MTQSNHPSPQQRGIDAFASEKLKTLEEKELKRVLKSTARTQGAGAERNGARLISFSDNDYLGLSTHSEVICAGMAAAEKFGAGAGASRLISGENPLNDAVERKLAVMKGSEAALLFGSGYLANIGTIPALVGPGDLIVMDELGHSCIHAGARLSGADVVLFNHNDAAHAESLLQERLPWRRALVITETVFSMDGDLAPLAALNAICDKTGAWLMTDDAHGLGVVGQFNPAPIQMGTLSKAAGVYGGYVCGPEALINLLISRARSFVYTTGLPPFVLGAAAKSLDLIAAHPALGRKALENAAAFCELMNLPVPQSAIVPMVLGDASTALRLSDHLEAKGFLVTAIRPPTVPEGTARLRFAFSAAHSIDQIQALAVALQEGLKAVS